jgi:hypothetical protein
MLKALPVIDFVRLSFLLMLLNSSVVVWMEQLSNQLIADLPDLAAIFNL